MSLTPEIGYVLLEEEDEWLYGLALGYSPSKGIELLAEVHGSAARDFEDDELLVQAGLRWTVHPSVTLLGAIGHGIRDPDEGELELSAYVGVQLLFRADLSGSSTPDSTE